MWNTFGSTRLHQHNLVSEAARFPAKCRPVVPVFVENTHRIHGAAIYGNMDPIHIPQSC